MTSFQPDPATTPDIPVGTVTFLFTDVEGSTQLLARLRDRYTELLAEHHRLLREIFARWGGREIGTQGDSFFVAFPRAGDAICAVVEAQRGFADHQWPEDTEVRVRMGLHTGEPWVVAEGYVGMDVHRAARIAHAGHGGQVLLSETTTSLVADDLPAGVNLLDLGRHQLKDMCRPERLQQLVIDGLPVEFPPLMSEAALPPAYPGKLSGNGIRETREVGASPYRGLAAFREDDAPFFFGRKTFTEQLAASVRQQDLVAVIVGPSGSGKSSVVFAGLLPELLQDGGWLAVSLRPGGRPFHALADALLLHLEGDLSEADRLIEVEKLARAMAAGELPLFHIVLRILNRRPDVQRLLLVVDQFEELFTQRPDPAEQRQFLDELLAASAAQSAGLTSPLVVLLTLRADFMGQALAHRPFADALQDGSLLLGPMNRAELQAVVEKPAELQGAAFETGLVSRILDDVGEEPGNLPLLEFALSLLWERMDRGWLTHEAYDAIGRVEGALARYAEEVFEALPEPQQPAAQRIFVQLVQPGEGTEDTRRVASRAELGDENWRLVQHLADKRLIVTGRDAAGQETVEVVHEALIRSWQRLRGWIGADRAFRVWQEGLRAAMRQWQANDHDEGALLRGAPLVAAETWLAERGDELSPAERNFIETSVAFRAGEQARRERRRRMIIAGLASGLAIALILLGVAIYQGNAATNSAEEAVQAAATAEAERAKKEIEVAARATAQANAEAEAQARATAQAQTETERLRAEDEVLARATAQANAEAAKLDALTQASIGLASQSIQELQGGFPERAPLLALEALENYPYTAQAERALGQAVFFNHLRHVLSHEGGVNTAFWSPDGTRIVTATDKVARIWDAGTGEELFTLHPEESRMWGAGWSPDGERVWVIENLTTSVWEASTGKRLFDLTGHEAAMHVPSWSPTGDRILSTSDDQTARIWDAATGEELAVFSGHNATTWTCGPVCTPESAAWSPDGQRVVTHDYAGEVFIWDPATGEELLQLRGHVDWVNTAMWAPDGQRVATSSDDATAKIWDATTGDELLSYTGPLGVINAVWSPDSTRVLLTFDSPDPAVMWDTSTGDEIFKFREHDAKIKGAEWSDDGSLIVTSDIDGSTMVWDSSSGEVLYKIQGNAGTVNETEWSPTYDQILTASSDGTAKVWDVADELTAAVIPNDGLGFRTGWWFPAGDRVYRSYVDGSVRVFDSETGNELLSTPTQEGVQKSRIMFRTHVSPSGEEILGVYWGGTARTWDARTGESLWEVTRDTDLYAGEWSPDGTRFALGWVDGVIQVYDARTGQELLSYDGHPRGEITWMRWSPDSSRFVTTDNFARFNIWDAATGELSLDLKSDETTYRVTAVAWSADGKRLAAYRDDGVLSIRDATTGETLQSMLGQDKQVTWIDWFPAQDRIMTSDSSGEIKIWDVESGAEVASLTFPDMYMAALSPDGHQVLVTTRSGPMIIFDIWQSREELIDLARECCVFRDLTPEERQQFGLPPVVQAE